jgi:hypothetical protein
MPDIDRAANMDVVDEDPIITTSTKQPRPAPRSTQKPMALGSQEPLNEAHQLPLHLNRDEPIDIFDFFLSKEVVEQIAAHTNLNANTNAGPDPGWKDVTTAEVYVYLGVLCYDAIYPKDPLRDYWNTEPEKGAIYPVITEAISRSRYESITRWFCINNPLLLQNDLPFERLEPLSTCLLGKFEDYWSPNLNIAVDETVYWAKGEAKERVIIPSKPAGIQSVRKANMATTNQSSYR